MKAIWKYTADGVGGFSAHNPDHTSRLYFPLMNEAGMKSSVTPELKGDISSSFAEYLMPPIVTEDLHRTNNSRYVWLNIENDGPWSINGLSPVQQSLKWTSNPEKSQISAQPGRFSMKRFHHRLPLTAEITITVPNTLHKVELWKVCIQNEGQEDLSFTSSLAVPIFGRHADHLRDHRQVTTMFQYTRRLDNGVLVKPSIVHDEIGHRINDTSYFTLGFAGEGELPERIWTRMQDFIGEGGSLSNPQAIFQNRPEPVLKDAERNGVEAVGAISFKQKILHPGAKQELYFLIGITEKEDVQEIFAQYNSPQKVETVLQSTLDYWKQLTGQVDFETGQSDFDEWTKWLAFQLKCRQIFGNSFLPDFGYGRGGRGWRDLWQDLLSIFLVDPESAKNEIVNNLKGIRIDGSNATIIGNQPGEFKADRNNIPRTWCDHGAWPLFALNFYIQQTGDYEVLFKNIEYWKDQFVSRSKERDEAWIAEDGNWLLDQEGQKYEGTVFEHVLIQQLSAFYHVGEHNILLLEGADWNDTLDMARNRGESVCFQAFYANNFGILAQLLEELIAQNCMSLSLLEEVGILLDRTKDQLAINYEEEAEKRALLDNFFDAVSSRVSGKRKEFEIEELIHDLRSKEEHAKRKIRDSEWVSSDKGDFFNGHYNDRGLAMHGQFPEGPRMDLTSQVMPVMFNVASDNQVEALYQSTKAILGNKKEPGLKLCTPYPEIDMNVGRITGFVYGFKEHGSKWMQQNIMFMYGLFHRNQLKAGYELFHDIFSLSNNSGSSKTFPGIPSFYEPDNRGSYMYLTGSSTWIFLGLVTQVFGIQGVGGNLKIYPKLSNWFFNDKGQAKIRLNFRKQRLQIRYNNPEKLAVEDYKIVSVKIEEKPVQTVMNSFVILDYEEIKSFGKDLVHIQIDLG